MEPIAAFEGQAAVGQRGGPLGQAAALHGLIDESLEGRGARRETDCTVVEPCRVGLPMSIDPLDAASGQASARPAGFVEHMHRVPGKPQRMRAGGPSDAGTDYRDRLRFTRHHTPDDTQIQIQIGVTYSDNSKV